MQSSRGLGHHGHESYQPCAVIAVSVAVLDWQFAHIYCSVSDNVVSISVISVKPYHKFTIPIKSEEYEPDTENGLSCNLKFEYTAKYPDEAPDLEILDIENFQEEDEASLREHILKEVCIELFDKQAANENLGTVMIFTLVSSAQEWLNQRWDIIRKTRDDDALRKAQEVEEAEMKRFEGTRVTVESFMRWKDLFDAEFAVKKTEKDEKDSKKLTGRELFLTDKTLIESDLKFLEDAGDSIKVDESLFQDIEELDLEELDGLEDDDS
uniref:RWD domain-containing protein n=1 Tax=Timema genevievae TaxID=629358 RepID=A0A7R9K4S2_TIMGE|nr:unnamed protein product [Timema genevievae]